MRARMLTVFLGMPYPSAACAVSSPLPSKHPTSLRLWSASLVLTLFHDQVAAFLCELQESPQRDLQAYVEVPPAV